MVQCLLLSYFVPCYQTLTWALRGVSGPLFPFQTPELTGSAILHLLAPLDVCYKAGEWLSHMHASDPLCRELGKRTMSADGPSYPCVLKGTTVFCWERNTWRILDILAHYSLSQKGPGNKLRTSYGLQTGPLELPFSRFWDPKNPAQEFPCIYAVAGFYTFYSQTWL